MLVKLTADGGMEELSRKPKWRKGDPTHVDKIVDSIKPTDGATKRDAEKFRAITDLSARLAKM